MLTYLSTLLSHRYMFPFANTLNLNRRFLNFINLLKQIIHLKVNMIESRRFCMSTISKKLINTPPLFLTNTLKTENWVFVLFFLNYLRWTQMQTRTLNMRSRSNNWNFNLLPPAHLRNSHILLPTLHLLLHSLLLTKYPLYKSNRLHIPPTQNLSFPLSYNFPRHFSKSHR